jgi:hypothetical protein
VQLGEAGLLLTDLVELDRKREFEAEILPRLRERLASGAFADRDGALAWLREVAAPMLPGADPLPALKAPLAPCLAAWALPAAPAVTGLRAWAES